MDTPYVHSFLVPGASGTVMTVDCKEPFVFVGALSRTTSAFVLLASYPEHSVAGVEGLRYLPALGRPGAIMCECCVPAGVIYLATNSPVPPDVTITVAPPPPVNHGDL